MYLVLFSLEQCSSFAFLSAFRAKIFQNKTFLKCIDPPKKVNRGRKGYQSMGLLQAVVAKNITERLCKEHYVQN
jgi:hypothetical protein